MKQIIHTELHMRIYSGEDTKKKVLDVLDLTYAGFNRLLRTPFENWKVEYILKLINLKLLSWKEVYRDLQTRNLIR